MQFPLLNYVFLQITPEDKQTLIIILTIVYGIAASITTLDIRIIQAKKQGLIPFDEDSLPKWVIVIYWIEWIILGILLLLNWKYSVIVYIIKFILKVLPVLEIIGNIIMSPFKKRQ